MFKLKRSILLLAILTGVGVFAYELYVNVYKTSSILDDRGQKTYYYTQGKWNEKVYFGFWNGDFLGHRVYREIPGESRKTFQVFHFRLEDFEFDDFYARGNSQFYLKDKILPFDPRREKIQRIHNCYFQDSLLVTEFSIYQFIEDSWKKVDYLQRHSAQFESSFDELVIKTNDGSYILKYIPEKNQCEIQKEF